MSRTTGIPLPEPLGYFLTWPTYGTWLPGDERGWVKRHHGFQLPDPVTELEAAARMTDQACRLDDEQRRLVEATIVEHCQIRSWTLHAVNCRSNHVHVVITASAHPDEVRKELKALCTRKLKELNVRRAAGSVPQACCGRDKWWAQRGSQRYINDEHGLEAAIQYVRDFQDFR